MKPKGKMINIAFCTILLLILPLSLRSQITFERYYGEQNAYGAGREVFQKNDGGYVFGGSTQFSGTETYFYLVRTDSFGDTLWTKYYGGMEKEIGYSMDVTTDGGYIIVGYTKSFGVDSVDVFVVRTDSFGDTLWTRTYGGLYEERGYSIKQTSDGGFIIAGRTNSYGAGGFDAYLIRIDSLGDTLWTRTYGDSLYEDAKCVEIAPDNHFVIAGQTSSFGAAYYDVYLIKIDPQGSIIWTQLYGNGGGGNDRAYSIGKTTGGGYIISGETSSFGATYYDVYLIKTDSLGDSLWAKLIGLDYGGNTEYHAGYSVEQTNDGGYIIAGYARVDGVSDHDLFLIRTNAFGDTLWTRLYGGALMGDWGYSVKETNDGGYIVSGNNSASGHGQAYLVKTDSQGNVAVQERPQHKQLAAAYLNCSPNPFSHSTTICFSVSSEYDKKANLHIYDATGRLVKSFKLKTNTFEIGDDLVPGVYFLKLTIGGHDEIQKLIKIR